MQASYPIRPKATTAFLAMIVGTMVISTSHAQIPFTHGMLVTWGITNAGQPSQPLKAATGDWSHSVAVLADGQLVAWGAKTEPDYGQLDVPPGLTNVVSVDAGTAHSVALRADGTVVCWGREVTCQVPPGLSNVIAVSAGGTENLALKSDGTVVTWGEDTFAVPPGLTNVVAIDSGEYQHMALREDGTVVVWGPGTSGSLNVPAAATNIVAIASADSHCLALTAEGKVIAWGSSWGTAPSGLANVVAIAAGQCHSLALKEDGTVVVWGCNYAGQLDLPTGLTNVVGIDAGYDRSFAIVGSHVVPILVNGRLLQRNEIVVRGPAEIQLLNPYAGGFLLYTTDGSDPAASGVLYTEPIIMRESGTVRAVAYKADVTGPVLLDPVNITVVPAITVVRADTAGSTTVEPAEGAYHPDGTATVTAIPAAGWDFLHWLGDVSGASPVVQVKMTMNRSLMPVFGTTLTTTVVGQGSILAAPSITKYPFGSRVVLSASPLAGSYFVSWGGAASGTNNPTEITVNSATPTVTALFALLGGSQYGSLTVVPMGRGEVNAVPWANRMNAGTTVVLTATPEPGQRFVKWGGAASGTQNPLTRAVNGTEVITAEFSYRPALYVPDWLTPLGDAGFSFFIDGEPGRSVPVEASTDLTTWTEVSTVLNPWGTVQFTDSAATNLAHRTYRAVAP